jgi:hypothetical protein
MMDEFERLLNDYARWVKEKTVLRRIDEWVEITTPYLDRHNDYIQIYARKTEEGYTLTDDGYTIEDLEQSGCALDTPKRRDLLQMTLNGFGVKLVDEGLEVHASSQTFALRKHNLVQAMLAVNDMFYLAMPMVASVFYEDVVKWLDLREIRYTPKVKFTGKSGFDHLFDFVIPKSRKQPERLIRAINRPNKDAAQGMVFSWVDTKGVRAANSRAYAILNDSEKEVPANVTDALWSYDVTPILWHDREESLEELAA